MPEGYLQIPDGLNEIRDELPAFVLLVARTARWVHPQAFQSLPVWYPESARGAQTYNAKWSTIRRNQKRNLEVKEANIFAGKALIGALGTKKVINWTCCHIWGHDDPTFQLRNEIVKDPRYYSCIGNMVWLPTPLKAFTDSIPEIKQMLRICAFHTYGWVCEHESATRNAALIKSGAIPDGYPKLWPRNPGDSLPPGTAPYSNRVINSIERRKAALRALLSNRNLPHFPYDRVQEVLDFWKIKLQ